MSWFGLGKCNTETAKGPCQLGDGGGPDGSKPCGGWLDDLRPEIDRRNADGAVELAAALKEWADEVLAMVSYVPPVSVVEYAAGRFLKGGDVEVPAAFIESIDVAIVGSRDAPWWKNATSEQMPFSRIPWGTNGPTTNPYYVADGAVVRPARASIEIRMVSGQKIPISCSAYEVDILVDAMRKAWKGI